MSRFLKVMIVLLAVAAMAVPATVFAADNLSLGGQMRVRGWYKDFDTDSTNSYVDQRLRIGGKFSVADGVSITFRTDFSEQTWGTTELGRTGWQLDRSHMDLDFSAFHLRAGQLYAGYGLTQVINSESTGAKFDLKAIPVSFFVLLNDNNGAASDAFLYAANYVLKADAFKANFIIGGQNDGAEENVNLFSGDVTMNLDAVKIAAELDVFTGDDANGGDAMGTQFFLDASMAASETLTVGGQFYYAQGTDDADETQYTYLGNDFNGYDPLFDLGTSLSVEQIMFGRPFDLVTSLVQGGFGKANGLSKDEVKAYQANSGALGGRLYAKVKASDALNLGASFAYMEPEEDTDGFDSAMFYAVGMTYALMPHTSLQAQLQYVDVDADIEKDTAMLGGVGLFVNF